MEQRKIVLLGKTGDGKSSAGNTILRKEVFTSEASAKSVTDKCVSAERMLGRRKITVIDTPGLFDTDRDEEEIKSEILKALIDYTPEVDAFVMVLKVGRYTKQENDVIQKILNTFKEEHVLKHTVILFTFGEQLDNQTIEAFVKTNSQLQELVDKCGGRCHVIDNKHWNNRLWGKKNKVQVKSLLKTIDKMVEENGCYSNELLQMLEKQIQEEIKKNKNVPPEQQRERAKEIVHEKILKQLIGASTGALIGALLGAGVTLASLVLVLHQICPLKELLGAKVAAFGSGGAAAVAGGSAEAGAGAVAVGAKAAAGTGVSAGSIFAVVLGAAAVVGAVGGGVTGWEAAEEADSMCDAMIKAAKANYDNATALGEKIKELVAYNKKIINRC